MEKNIYLKNSFSGIFQKIAVAVITFVTIPVFIKLLGTEMYGIFATIGVLGELGRLTNFGFNAALVKFLSAQGKSRESDHDFIIAVLIQLLFLVPITIALILLCEPILTNILNVPHQYLIESKYLFITLVLANFFLFMGMPFSATMESQKRLYIVNYLQMIYSILYWGLILIALLLHYKLKELGFAILTASFIWLLLTIVKTFHVWGKVDFAGLGKSTKNSLKKQASYGIQVYLTGLMGFLWEPVLKVLISNYFGITYAGFYDIAMKIKTQLYRFIQSAVWPLFQMFSELKDPDKVRRIIIDMQEKLIYFLILLCVVLAFTAHSLVTLWIGNDTGVISMNLIVINCSSLLLMLSLLPINIYLMSQHPDKIFITQAVYLFVNYISLVFLYKKLGYSAFYISYILTHITAFSFSLYYQKKYINELIYNTKTKLINLLFFILISAITGYITYLFTYKNPWVNLIITPLSMVPVSFLLVTKLKLITNGDVNKYFGSTRFAPLLLKIFK